MKLFDEAELAKTEFETEAAEIPAKLADIIWKTTANPADDQPDQMFLRPMSGYEKKQIEQMLFVANTTIKDGRMSNSVNIDMARAADQLVRAISYCVVDERGRKVIDEEAAKALPPKASAMLNKAIDALNDGDQGKDGLRAVS